ncbi:Protein NRT1/ PTR FAMILY 1.2, partial [Linum grandiflorum]
MAVADVSVLGGWKTLPFIIANEIFEKAASVGLIPVCIEYLTNEYFIGLSGVSTFVLVFGAVRNFTPIFGAALSNSYTQFKVIAFGSWVTLMGMTILWATAFFPALRPHTPDCLVGEKLWKLLLLFSSFGIMAIGGGGIRPCCPTFGANQINNPNDPNNRKTIEGYYSLYYATVGFSVVVSVLAMSEINKHVEWSTLFAIPPILMFLSFTSFMVRSSRYVKAVPTTKSRSRNGIGTVIMAAWRRRQLSVAPSDTNQARWFHYDRSTFVHPTNRLRFLNRACLLIGDEKATNPVTSLSTVREVEEFKALISVIPIWSTGIITTVATSPGALPNYQAQAMDRHLGHLNLTPADYVIFTVGTMTLWMLLYARVIVPFLTRYNSKFLRNGIQPRIRMAIGIALSCIANLVAGFVENHRRLVSTGPTMSGNWLIPQLSLMGLAEAMYLLAQLDFFNSRFPNGMKSLGNALVSLGQCFGMLAATMILRQVKTHTGWVNDNLYHSKIDYYYWLVAGLSFFNLCYFLVCTWAYGNDHTISWDDDSVEGR